MSLYPYFLPTPPPEVVAPQLIADIDKVVFVKQSRNDPTEACHSWIAHVLFISALSVGFWDWLVCLGAEYKQIWK
jgi:hypothetical protein